MQNYKEKLKVIKKTKKYIYSQRKRWQNIIKITLNIGAYILKVKIIKIYIVF